MPGSGNIEALAQAVSARVRLVDDDLRHTADVCRAA
jgi:hypothetical protein